MKWLRKISFSTIFMLALSGCDVNIESSQTPKMSDYEMKTPELIYQKGKDAYINGRYNIAIRHFRAFLLLHSKHEKDVVVRNLLINCYVVCQQFEEALQALELLSIDYPDRLLEVVNKKEEILAQQDRKIRAAQHLQERTMQEKTYQRMIDMVEKLLTQKEKSA